MEKCGNPDVYFYFLILYMYYFTVYSDKLFHMSKLYKFTNRTKYKLSLNRKSKISYWNLLLFLSSNLFQVQSHWLNNLLSIFIYEFQKYIGPKIYKKLFFTRPKFRKKEIESILWNLNKDFRFSYFTFK